MCFGDDEICPNCKSYIDSDQKFCKECGMSLKVTNGAIAANLDSGQAA
jgi:predicted amidophosphoribosyltransferase